MSHELRTPLNAIIGYCGIMLEGMSGEVDDQAMRMLGRIDSNAIRLLNLINDLLDFAKLEASRLVLRSEAVDPRELMTRCKEQLQVLANEKGLAFELQIAEDMPTTITGDSERLEQIVVNLLSNGIKFTESGCVTLSVEKQDDKFWTFQVHDTGIGIPSEAQDMIFEEFRQVDGSTTRTHGGTGLGLAITRRLVQEMGGDITCTSVVDEGSTFTVVLPIQ